MRWQVVAQIARHANALAWGGLSKVADLSNQRVDLLLLADDDLVQLIQQVFGEAGFDLKINQALFGVVGVFHACIGHE